MDLDPQVEPRTSVDVHRGLRQSPKKELEGAINDEDPNIGDDL
jgi:hypothetical protein